MISITAHHLVVLLYHALDWIILVEVKQLRLNGAEENTGFKEYLVESISSRQRVNCVKHTLTYIFLSLVF